MVVSIYSMRNRIALATSCGSHWAFSAVAGLGSEAEVRIKCPRFEPATGLSEIIRSLLYCPSPLFCPAGPVPFICFAFRNHCCVCFFCSTVRLINSIFIFLFYFHFILVSSRLFSFFFIHFIPFHFILFDFIPFYFTNG